MTASRHPKDEVADLYARQEMALILGHACPTCGAVPDEKCIRPDGQYQTSWTHPARTRLAFPPRRTA